MWLSIWSLGGELTLSQLVAQLDELGYEVQACSLVYKSQKAWYAHTVTKEPTMTDGNCNVQLAYEEDNILLECILVQ